MPTNALRRLLLGALCLSGAILACARAEVPIVPGEQQLATPVALAPSATPIPVDPTRAAAETNAVLRLTPSPTPTIAPTATRDYDIIPIPNGTFDTDLSVWSFTPDWVIWQDGYARANASDNIGGAILVQTVHVPAAPLVSLHFSVRSEDAGTGECWVESKFRSVHIFPEDNQWHEFEVDFTPEAGTDAPVNLTAKNNGHCHWLDLDDVYWKVPPGFGQLAATVELTASVEATLTPEAGAASATPAEATATVAPAATLGAIPADATFTRDFSVSREGGQLIGTPADLRDDQTITWASLRNGPAHWVFDLGAPHELVGVRLYAHRDGDEDTTLLGIDVSPDGATWTLVREGSGSCGDTANCDVIAQETLVDLAVSPATARYLRLRGGPTRFALAEVQIAIR